MNNNIVFLNFKHVYIFKYHHFEKISHFVQNIGYFIKKRYIIKQYEKLIYNSQFFLSKF